MKVFAGKNGKKGFMLLEVVLVVVILSIAMAITVPGVVRLSRDLKITELDDIAREIYTAAQSRSISLSVSGQLPMVGGVEQVVTLADGGSTETTKFTAISNKSGSAFCSSGQIDMLLPLGSIDETVRQNYYLIEYNPVTAAVKGVYYWEDADNDFLTAHYDDTADSRDVRMKYAGGMVGYYGGEDVKRLPPPPPEGAGDSSVTAKLINDEELYLEITPGSRAGILLEGNITVTLTDMDTNVSKQIASFANDKNSDFSDRLTKEGGVFKLTLDSLRSGLRFSKLTDTEGHPLDTENHSLSPLSSVEKHAFHPGCNLKVTVSFQEKEKQAKDENFFTNSLFASVQGPFGDRTAMIDCGRHLENLGVYFVYPDGKYPDMTPVNKSDPLNGVKKAIQTKDIINWHSSLGVIGADPADVPFKPIVNDGLKSYNGQGNTISHMDIFDVPSAPSPKDVLDGLDKGNYGIGLFSRFQGDSLERIKLVDCAVKDLAATDPQYVGLLAGKIESGNVSDCHAYATGTGGVFNCYIDVSGADNVGGLFGSVRSANVTKSSASLTKIAGGAYAGGLAGHIVSNASITSCYADTGVWEDDTSGLSGGTVGGLLGSVGDPLTLNNSYAAGWARGTNVYGLVGSGSGASIKNCYAAVMNGEDIADKLVPGTIAPSALTNCINYSGGHDSFDALLSPSPEGTESAFVTATSSTTHAYGMPPEAGPYPYPRLKAMPHYGDWPQGGVATTGMAYYEVYQSGSGCSIRFYNRAVPYQDLIDEEINTVVMDGYAVMLSPTDAAASRTVAYNDHPVDGTDPAAPAEVKLLNASEKFGSMTIAGITGNIITIDGTEYQPLFLSNAMMTENTLAETGSYYQKLMVTVGGRTAVNVYFNPYVAKSEFVNVVPGFDATKPLGATILRSSRQVTAYSNHAMQTTAIGKDAQHTLRLERDISLQDTIRTDPTVPGGITSKDLVISDDHGTPNVSLELNGKTLTGTRTASVVTSEGGKLEIHGGTIKGSDSAGDSVTAAGEITVVGCTIIP